MEDIIKKIEGLIIEIGKSYKATQFYPNGHPALDATVEKAIAYIKGATKEGENISFSITRNGFMYEDKIIGAENKAFFLFSKEFFTRNILKLFFKHDVAKDEFIRFLKTLLEDSKDIREAGGIEKIMFDHDIKNIWPNEADYEKMLQKQKEADDAIADFEEEPPFNEFLEPPKEKEELLEEAFEDIDDEDGALADLKDIFVSNKELFELLREALKEVSQTSYEEKLNKIGNACHHLKNARKYESILKVALFLTSLSMMPTVTIPRKKEMTTKKIAEITTPEMTHIAIDAMTIAADKEKYIAYLHSLGESYISVFFDYLGQKGDINTRNNVSSIVSSFGKDALNKMEQWLDDSRWYVICSAIAVIGKIGANEGLELLIPMLDHPDLRVQREIVKALGVLRCAESLNILTDIIKRKDENLLKTAIVALGELKFEISIPILIEMSKSGIFHNNEADIRKSAIIALGKTGSSKAVPPLLHILKDISFLGKQENDEMRILAAKSIAEIGGEEALKALEIGGNSSKPIIRDTCRKMLEKVISKINIEGAAEKEEKREEVLNA